MRKNDFLDRLVRSRFRSRRDVENLFHDATNKARVSRHSRTRPGGYLTGVHNGQFFRVKIPPRKKLLPNVPKLSSPLAAPKPVGEVPTAQKVMRKAEQSDEEPFAIFVRKFERWWQANWAVLLLNFGSICTLVGFTRSDVLELRSLAVTGSLSNVVYLSVQRPFRAAPVVWSLTFASVNGWKIKNILEERTSTVRLTKEQEDIYVTHFMPHGVTPKQFEAIYAAADVLRFKKGDVIKRQGEVLEHVYLIASGHTSATALGRRVSAASVVPDAEQAERKTAMSGGAWAGEIQFLEQYWIKEQKHIQKLHPSIQRVDAERKNSKGAEASSGGVVKERKSKGVKNGAESASARTGDKQSDDEHPLDGEHVDDPDALKNVEVNISHKRTFRFETRPRPESTRSGIAAKSLITITAVDDCVVLRWSHEKMEELMARSTDMRAAMTRAMTAAIVGKVIHFTVSRAQSGAILPMWLQDWKYSAGAKIEVDEEEDVGEDGKGQAKENLPSPIIRKFS